MYRTNFPIEINHINRRCMPKSERKIKQLIETNFSVEQQKQTRSRCGTLMHRYTSKNSHNRYNIMCVVCVPTHILGSSPTPRPSLYSGWIVKIRCCLVHVLCGCSIQPLTYSIAAECQTNAENKKNVLASHQKQKSCLTSSNPSAQHSILFLNYL